MATSFSAAALGAEGLAADVTMLVGNGYVPGHADYALELFRAEPGLRGAVREQAGPCLSGCCCADGTIGMQRTAAPPRSASRTA